VWPVFAILVLFGSARAFMMPATQAVLRNMVPDRTLQPGRRAQSSAFHVAVIAGPVLGGLLYLAGPSTVYLVAAPCWCCRCC
jgi:MFS family permease